MSREQIKHTNEKNLLALPVKNLGLCLQKSSFISPLIKQVSLELEKKGFSLFKPHFYLGDEWFSPEGETAVAIPFYLAHPRLTLLEKKYTGEAEGETDQWCLKLLRHEVGHCFDHAYNFSQTTKWKKLFGNPNKKYDPDNYSFDSKSKDFVINLDDHYAQAHPDEDFAETFAVWLEKPKKIWKREYKGKSKALEKLEYIEEIFTKTEDKKTYVSPRNLICRADKLRISLRTYYNRRRKQLAA